jgi:hypothetical protein
MLNRLKLAFVLFAALWLPCQATAAAFGCARHLHNDVAVMAVAAADADMADDCPMHQSGQTHDSAPAKVTVGCDQCGYCHIATASLLPSAAVASPLMPLQQVLVAIAPPRTHSHVSAPPWQPPKRTA